MGGGWGMRDESRAREYEFRKDREGLCTTLVYALQRGTNRRVRANIDIKGYPTAR